MTFQLSNVSPLLLSVLSKEGFLFLLAVIQKRKYLTVLSLPISSYK